MVHLGGEVHAVRLAEGFVAAWADILTVVCQGVLGGNFDCRAGACVVKYGQTVAVFVLAAFNLPESCVSDDGDDVSLSAAFRAN